MIPLTWATWNSQKVTDTESRTGVARSWKKGGMDSYCLISRVSIFLMKRVQDRDGGDTYTTMYLIPVNCALNSSEDGQLYVE